MERNRHFWTNSIPKFSFFVLALCLFVSPALMANENPNYETAELDCDNLTDGGSVVGNQTLCSPYDVEVQPILNVTFPSGGDIEEEIQYLWLQSSVADYYQGSPNWTPVPGQPIDGLPDLHPGSLTSTTYFIRCARRDFCDLYVAESNIVKIKIAHAPVVSGATATSPGCSGSATGSIDLDVSGGEGGVEFTWHRNSATGVVVSSNQNPNGLSAGNYYVNIEDGCGCTTTFGPVNVSSSGGIVINSDVDDLDCYGDVDASITATASGSTGPYTYVWDSFLWPAPFTLSNTISDLAPGTYTLTVTDAGGCTATATYVISDPLPVIINVEGTDITCNGDSDGSTIVYVSGINPPYTYIWSTGNPNNSMSDRPAGTYTVTVTDGNGCSEVGSYTVNEPGELTITDIDVTDANCNGEEGFAQVNLSGGTPPYTFENGGAGVAGNYGVLVTDANGCVAVGSYVINEPTELVLTAADVPELLCNGDSDATISVSADGGSPGYNYLWSTGDVGVTSVSGLSAGTYSVTVLDTHGCSDVVTVEVVEPPLLTLDASGTDVVCNGDDDGTASAAIAGGTTPYTISWTGGGSTADLSGLAPGDYTVDVTDANGCTASASVTIGEPDALETSASSTNVVCNGDGNGTAGVTATGGIAPYTYAWSNGASIPDLADLTPGDYTVIVSDANGCTSEASVTITEPDALVVDVTGVDILCNGDGDGTVSAAIAGGTEPYTITWNTGDDTADLSGLSGGTYSVDIVDANGCTTSGSIDLIEPDALGSTITGVMPSCNVASGDLTTGNVTDGTASVVITGGTEPYTYAWHTGGTTATITDLGASDYFLTVTDANGCVIEDEFTLGQPDAVTVDVSGADASCSDASNGSATAAGAGGTGDITYAWSTGDTGASVDGLAAGTYTVVATDENGCTAEASVTIGNEYAVTVSASSTNAACTGSSTGSASASAAGGNAPYSYSWDNGATGSDIGGLTAGTYTVEVTDGNGCTATTSVSVGNDYELAASANSSPAACVGSASGSATASALNGNAPYSYSWDNGGTSAEVGGLTEGNYTVTITDANGCSATATVYVGNAYALEGFATATGVSCAGDSNGSATATATNGNAPYSYAWSNGGNSATISGLSSGAYSVVITDANGCSVEANTFVGEPQGIAVSATSTDIVCNGFNNGSATATVSGGTGGYTVTWSNGVTGNNTSGLTAGSYTVTAIDANGCTASASVTISEPGIIALSIDGSGASCSGGGSVGVTAQGGVGNYTYNWSNGANTAVITGLNGGTYSVTVADANGCSAVASLNIETPNPLGAFADNTATSCNGSSDGSASAGAYGGTAPYTYAWSNGGSGESISGVSAGSYTVTVTDANGCTAEISTFVGEPSAVGVSAWASGVGCDGGPGGEASSQAFNGTPPYTYAWSNGAPWQNISDLLPGNYEVTATDANGCTGTASIFVPQSAAIGVTVEGFNALCGETGYAVANVTGGSGGYTYAWSNGSNGQTAGDLPAGSYSVTVTDAGGCTTSGSVTIAGSNGLSISGSGTDTDCNNDGTVSASASGGSGTYTYSWSNGATGASQSGLAPGNYTVTATDANGCSATLTVSVGNSTTDPGCDDGDCSNGTEYWDGCNCISGTAPVDPGCDDGNCANGVEFWDGCGCVAGTAPVDPGCDDGNCANGVEYWDGCGCVAGDAPVDPGCDDGNCANGVEFWDGCGCVAGTAPVDPGCDDGNCANGVEFWDGCGCVAGEAPVDPGCDDGICENGIEFWDGCNCQNGDAPAPIELTTSATPSSCADSGDGTASVSATGGTGSYTYAWSNGETTADLAGANAGTYTVVVTDSNGCSASTDVTVESTTLSNPFITTDDNTTLCLNNSSTINVSVDNPGGANSDWFITDENSIILDIGVGNPVDFSAAGEGVCVIWYISYTGDVEGYEVGANAFALSGCFVLSNSIAVTRLEPNGGELSTNDPTVICVDGTPDPIDVAVEGANGTNSAWVITDVDGNILGVPAAPPFDLDGAGAGTCLIWHVAYEDISGVEVGANAADLGGCFSLSNPITIERNDPNGGTISTTDPTTICAGDGTPDPITVALDGAVGEGSNWVITDTDGNILGLPTGPTFDLDGAGAGTCVIWHLSSYGDLGGAAVGNNAADLTGCYELSNPIEVIRQQPEPGTIATTDPTTLCVGDGEADLINVTVDGADASNYAWVITDEDGNILGLPASTPFDLEGAGAGTCLIWNLAWDGELSGANIGANAADLVGCYNLSNPITVIRNEPNGGTIATDDPTTICVDGTSDPINVDLTGNVGEGSAWVITDEAGNILGLPAAPPFDLDGAGAGTCLIWNVSFYGDLTGVEVGGNANGIGGCFSLSNPITVVRQDAQPSVISTNDPTEICAGDGEDDLINIDMVPGVGDNHAWVITDDAGNILALPAAPPFNLEGAGGGTCLIWCVDYYGDLGGAEVGNNASDLTGCFELSNPITVVRTDAASIGNYVWFDSNQDGCQDLGELGIGQVLVNLLTAGPDGQFCTFDDQVVASEYTQTNGYYLFSCVAPGDYIINLANLPGPFTNSPHNACGDDTNDSDIDPLTGCSDVFTIGAGSANNDLTIDAGLFGCDNLTDGGNIGYTQETCPGFDVEPFVSTVAPSGGNGIVEYLWMYATTPGTFPGSNWTAIPNSNVAEYASVPLGQTTYFIRCSRMQGCDAYVESNIITVSVINNPTFCFDGFIGIDADVISADEIEVRWSTNPEREAYQYHVEVSENGADFETVGSMTGYGIDNDVNNYAFTHDNEMVGTIFYRVRRVANGVTDYSEIVSVDINSDQFGEIAIYPNPVQHEVNIKFMEPLLSETSAALITPLGKVLTTVTIPAGTITYTLDVDRYSVGTYFLRITNDDLGTKGFKLVKPAQ